MSLPEIRFLIFHPWPGNADPQLARALAWTLRNWRLMTRMTVSSFSQPYPPFPPIPSLTIPCFSCWRVQTLCRKLHASSSLVSSTMPVPHYLIRQMAMDARSLQLAGLNFNSLAFRSSWEVVAGWSGWRGRELVTKA